MSEMAHVTQQIIDTLYTDMKTILIHPAKVTGMYKGYTLFFLRRRFININKQYIQDSRKERHKEHSENNNEERKRDKPEAAIVYSYAKLSGIYLIEQFSLYSDQTQTFELLLLKNYNYFYLTDYCSHTFFLYFY